RARHHPGGGWHSKAHSRGRSKGAGGSLRPARDVASGEGGAGRAGRNKGRYLESISVVAPSARGRAKGSEGDQGGSPKPTKAEAATDKERRRSDITETEGDQGGSPKGLAAGRSQDGLLE